MSFLYNFSFSRLKFLLLLTAVFVLPACSAGGGGSTQGSSNNLGISWTAPSEREDVTPISLSEIAGYRVYYGTETGVYQNQLAVDGSVTLATISGLSSGTYYVAVTTIDTEGRESAYSQEVIATV